MVSVVSDFSVYHNSQTLGNGSTVFTCDSPSACETNLHCEVTLWSTQSENISVPIPVRFRVSPIVFEVFVAYRPRLGGDSQARTPYGIDLERDPARQEPAGKELDGGPATTHRREITSSASTTISCTPVYCAQQI
jgi:hypothetical protein